MIHSLKGYVFSAFPVMNMGDFKLLKEHVVILEPVRLRIKYTKLNPPGHIKYIPAFSGL